MHVHEIGNEAELEIFAATYLETLTGATHTATVVALSGDLGAGKTTCVQAIARALSVDEPVTSPTFLIQKTYPVTHPVFTTLVHIDAYRLESATELVQLGWEETCADPAHLICLEWPERVADILPAHTHYLEIHECPDGTRLITATP